MRDIVEFYAAGYSITLKPSNPVTICEITSNGIPSFAYGLGVLKHGDEYDRVRGMEQALRSALQHIAKDDRHFIWDRYFSIFPRPPHVSKKVQAKALESQAVEHLMIARDYLKKASRISQPA